MSVKVTELLWKLDLVDAHSMLLERQRDAEHGEVNGRVTCADQVVLVRFGDAAHSDGSEARPSVGTVARECHCCERTVQRVLRMWTLLGLLVVVREADRARHMPTVYRIDLTLIKELLRLQGYDPGDAASTGKTDQSATEVTQSHPAERKNVTGPGDTVSPKPSYNRHTTVRAAQPRAGGCRATPRRPSGTSFPVWDQALPGMEAELGMPACESWIWPLEPVADNGVTLVLKHPEFEYTARRLMSAEPQKLRALEQHTKRSVIIIGPNDKLPTSRQ